MKLKYILTEIAMSEQLTSTDSGLLFKALGANGLFSLASGLVMTLGAQPIAGFLGVGNHFWVLGLGIMLIGFGLSLLLHYRRQRVSRAEAVAISVMDLGWVIGSAALVLLAPDLFSREGIIAVVAVAAVVLIFFELQALALWRVSRRA